MTEGPSKLYAVGIGNHLQTFQLSILNGSRENHIFLHSITDRQSELSSNLATKKPFIQYKAERQDAQTF